MRFTNIGYTRSRTQGTQMEKNQSPFHKRILRLFGYVFLLCFCVPFLTSCESSKTIVNGLDEKEANEILVFLNTKGIEAVKVKAASEGAGAKLVLFDITVNESQAQEAMYLLNQQGLPRRRSQNLLGIFSTGGLVPSDLQEKIKYRAALSEQIASTIRKIDGILDADVNVSFPEEDPLNPGQSKGRITASVWVKHSGVLDDPNSHLITKIKRLVAASVTGLDYDNVTVIAERSRLGEMLGTVGAPEEEKQYVSVWSLIVAKDSLTRFRVIFFSFSLAILLLLLSLIWLLWKVLPLLHKHGEGIKSLFSISPIHTGPGGPPVAEKKVDASKAPKKEGEPKEKGLVDKDIDET